MAGSGKLARETKSLLSLFRILDALQCMPRGCVSVAEFHAEVVNHMRYWQEAYPDEDHKPKHHMSVHLGKMYERHGMLWNCFVHERKHKTLKDFATTTSNTLNYEQSVSTDLLNAHVEAMSHPEAFNTGCYLVDPRAFINEIRGHRHECVCWELMQVMVISKGADLLQTRTICAQPVCSCMYSSQVVQILYKSEANLHPWIYHHDLNKLPMASTDIR